MIITSLEKDKKHLVRLTVSSGEEYLIDYDVCLDNGICTDMEINAEMLEEWCFESDYRRAKSRAIWYLDRTDHTEKAMYQKLLRAGFSKQASAKAVGRLAELGIIDDRRYAERFADRCAEHNISKREALQKMLQKGVPYDLAKEALENTESDEEAQIKNLLEGKYSSKIACENGTQKVYAALVRKGFSYSAIRNALKSHTQELEFSEEY